MELFIKQTLINENIIAKTVRLIAESGEMIGIVSIEKALEAAAQVDLDLVEISPQAKPPVCKIMDYGKFRYDQGKKEQASKKRQRQVQIKEVKFRPNIEEADYQMKLRKMTEFLQEKKKIKITLRFVGREMAHKELGLKLLERTRDDLTSISTVEFAPRLEGKNMIMVLAPV